VNGMEAKVSVGSNCEENEAGMDVLVSKAW